VVQQVRAIGASIGGGIDAFKISRTTSRALQTKLRTLTPLRVIVPLNHKGKCSSVKLHCKNHFDKVVFKH